jgi:dihydrofolate reductase
MSSLQYQCTMSLDGFIAGPGGDVGWLARYAAAGDPTAERMLRDTAALLVGRRTFGGGDPLAGTGHEGEPYGGGWTGPQFVLTHRVPKDPVAGVTFVTDLKQAVAAARKAAGAGRYVGVLGALVAAQCVEAGLLDEVYVAVAPVMLGGGVRLFDRPHGSYVQLEPLDLAQDSALGLLTARYRVVY